jgi:hypothetical protein
MLCACIEKTAHNRLIGRALLQNQRDSSKWHTAFTRQWPVENETSSARDQAPETLMNRFKTYTPAPQPAEAKQGAKVRRK